MLSEAWILALRAKSLARAAGVAACVPENSSEQSSWPSHTWASKTSIISLAESSCSASTSIETVEVCTREMSNEVLAPAASPPLSKPTARVEMSSDVLVKLVVLLVGMA